MSTSSSRARRLADASKVPGVGGDDGAQVRRARLEAAEAATAQAAQAATNAAAAVEAADALRAEIKGEEVEEEGGDRGFRWIAPAEEPPPPQVAVSTTASWAARAFAGRANLP